jgi:hypothetical protein
MIDLALDGRVMINSELDEAIQELDLLFNTENTELLGYRDFGTNFEQFSWQLTSNEESIKKYVDEKINTTLYLSRYRTNVEVTCDKGEYRLIYYIKISVYDEDNNKVTRSYEFR